MIKTTSTSKDQGVDASPATVLGTPPVQTEKIEHNFPTEVINLPSKGLLYPEDSPLRSGTIEIKYMTAKEEDILSTTSYIKNGIVLDKICESIIVTPGVKYNDLLIGDKNALLLAARIYGYGPEYNTTVTKSDGSTVKLSVDLTQVGNKYFDSSLITPGTNHFSLELPMSKKTIEFQLLTVGKQKEIEADVKGLKSLGPNKPEQNLTVRLRHMITSVDGNSDIGTINKFVNNMLARDSRAFREYVQEVQPDINLNIQTEDPNTGETFRGDVTIGVDLLYPDYKPNS